MSQPNPHLDGWIASTKSGSVGNWEGSEKSINGTRQWGDPPTTTGKAEGKSWGAESSLSSMSGSNPRLSSEGKPDHSHTWLDTALATEPPILPSMPPMLPPTDWQTNVPSDSKWESGSLGSSPRPTAAEAAAAWDGNVGGDEGDPRRDVTGWDGGERHANHPSDGNPGSQLPTYSNCILMSL